MVKVTKFNAPCVKHENLNTLRLASIETKYNVEIAFFMLAPHVPDRFIAFAFSSKGKYLVRSESARVTLNLLESLLLGVIS